ncbi:MAG: major capsid protein [Arenicella sp.]
MLGTYTTYELANMIKIVQPPSQFFSDTFFPAMITSEKEEISFDVETDGEQLAPFVHPSVQGKIIEGEGYQTNTFKPAYIKVKSGLRPGQVIKRRAGEQFGGSLSNEQRRQLMIAGYLQDHENRIQRRIEVMAAEALVYGRVTVVGDDYPEKVVDFGRKASNTIALAGAARWSDSNSTPLKDLEDWSLRCLDETGFAGDTLILSSSAWNLLSKHNDFNDQLDRRRGIKDVPFISPEVAKRVQYKGAIGDFDIFVYSGRYKNKSGGVVQLMDDNRALMIAREGLKGIQAYGAIQDLSNLVAIDRYTKMWEEKDPSIEVMLTQTAPLVVPRLPNAVVSVVVN